MPCFGDSGGFLRSLVIPFSDHVGMIGSLVSSEQLSLAAYDRSMTPDGVVQLRSRGWRGRRRCFPWRETVSLSNVPNSAPPPSS